MTIPDTPELELIVVRADVDLDGIRSAVGTVISMPRDKAMTAMRTGAFDLASRYQQTGAEGAR